MPTMKVAPGHTFWGTDRAYLEGEEVELTDDQVAQIGNTFVATEEAENPKDFDGNEIQKRKDVQYNFKAGGESEVVATSTNVTAAGAGWPQENTDGTMTDGKHDPEVEQTSAPHSTGVAS